MTTTVWNQRSPLRFVAFSDEKNFRAPPRRPTPRPGSEHRWGTRPTAQHASWHPVPRDVSNEAVVKRTVCCFVVFFWKKRFWVGKHLVGEMLGKKRLEKIWLFGSFVYGNWLCLILFGKKRCWWNLAKQRIGWFENYDAFFGVKQAWKKTCGSS